MEEVDRTTLVDRLSIITSVPRSRIHTILDLFRDTLGSDYIVEVEMTEVGWMFTGMTEDEKDCVTVVFGSEVELVPVGSA